MATFISRLFAKNGDRTLENLRKIIAQNNADREWVESFRARAIQGEAELRRMFGEFADDPSIKLAEDILRRASTVSSHTPILNRLSEISEAPTNQKILDRTLPAVRSALESVKASLESELEASRKRDSEFDGASMRVVGGVVNSGWRSPEEIAAAVESSATKFIKRELERATGYLSRLDSLDAKQLRGPIGFCLGESQ
jgi:hypothetical protein